jgi:hypothetical protein
MAAQVRIELDAGKQSCAGRSPTSSGQNRLAQAKCFSANSLAQSKPGAQTAENRVRATLHDLAENQRAD